MLNMDVYNVVGFLIQIVSLIQSTVRHVPRYWPPENDLYVILCFKTKP